MSRLVTALWRARREKAFGIAEASYRRGSFQLSAFSYVPGLGMRD
jgi:hypothetical protein